VRHAAVEIVIDAWKVGGLPLALLLILAFGLVNVSGFVANRYAIEELKGRVGQP
jgi:hypothetical protein